MRISNLTILAASALLPLAAGALHGGTPARGDAAAGRAAFAQCAGCHSLSPGRNGVGPSLNGVYGRPVGSMAGFAYSKALLEGRGQSWTPGALDAFLASPNKAYPGNKMYLGVADPRTRANIVAFLATKPSK